MMTNNASLERQLRTLRKRSTFTLFLTWLALFFTVVGIAAGYKNFLRVHDKAKAAQQTALQFSTVAPTLASKESVELWKQDISEKLAETSEQSATELAELKAVKESNTYISEALAKQVQQITLQQNTHQQVAAPSQDWKVNDARYLLQVASRKLVLDHDITAATHALRLADQALSDAAMPSLLSVRTQIAKDIVSLNNHKPVMLESLVMEVDTLAKLLKPQKVISKPDIAVQTFLDVSEQEGRNSMLNRMKESINKAVVIRTYDENLAKKISGDTEAVSYALLQLRLEGLKLLALKQQQAAYDQQLIQVVEQLESDSSQLLAQPVMQSLDVLRSFKLITDAPKILSIELLSAALTEKSGMAQ